MTEPESMSVLEEFYQMATQQGGEFELALTTANLYVSWVRTFLAHIGKDSREVTKEDVESYIRYCRRTYMDSTLESKFKVIRSYFTTLIEAGLMEQNPFEDVKLRRPRRGRRRTEKPHVFIPHEDIEQMLEALELAPPEDYDKNKDADDNYPKGEFKKAMIQVLVRLLYCSGLRIQEAHGAREMDINRTNQEVYIRGKGGRFAHAKITKLVPFWEHYIAYLQLLRERNPQYSDENPLFPYSDRWLRELVVRLGGMVGIKGKRSPHIYRHSFCTELARRRVRLETIRQLARHKSITTTLRYTHVVSQFVEEQLSEIDLL